MRVTLRSAGRSFGSARSIGRGDPLEPAAGIDERGDVVVAWSRKHRIWARVRLAGHGWGPVHAIGTSIQRPGTISAAAAGGRGRFLVSWQSATIADEEQGIPERSRQGSGRTSGRWHASLLETDSYLPRSRPGAGHRGRLPCRFRGLWWWGGCLGRATATNCTRPGRLFSQPTLVSVPWHGLVGDLAVGPTGAAVLVWLDPSGLPTALVRWRPTPRPVSRSGRPQA